MAKLIPLIFVPSQPNYLLEAAGRTLKAGDVFEGPSSLLKSDDIQKAPAGVEVPVADEVDEDAEEQETIDSDSTESTPAHSPDRAERSSTSATRSEDH